MLIDYIFDPSCPWCFIGKRRLSMAVAMRPGLQTDIRWRPFLLNPDIPAEGVGHSDYLLRMFGGETRMRRFHGAVGEAGRSVAINFDFAKIRSIPNTVNAQRLIRFAGRRGKAEEMIEALFTSYFIDAMDIGDTAVLIGIGASLGLPRRALRSYLRSGEDIDFIYRENVLVHRLGVDSVPSFVFNGGVIVAGAQEPCVLARVMDAAGRLRLFA